MLISGLQPPAQEISSQRRGRRLLLRTAVAIGGLTLLGLVLFLLGERGFLGAHIQRRIQLELTRRHFNRLYSLSSPPFLQQPNEFLARTTAFLPRGEALVVACGQGRNAVYLAQEGWRVTAFDISDKGLEIARRAAERDGVTLNAFQADAEEFDYGRNRWDLLLLVYAPISYDNPALMARIKDSVRPGGYILVEMPIEMRRPPEQRPRLPGDLLPGELPDLFHDFEVLSYSETIDISDFYRERTLIARLLARKP
jgi:SAM-dependent methyltransferase